MGKYRVGSAVASISFVATAASWVIVGSRSRKRTVRDRRRARRCDPHRQSRGDSSDPGSNAVAAVARLVSAILPGAKLLSQKRHAKTTEATPALAYNELQSVRGA
jgi:hypothetical protein